jgi:hypothetical protein
MLDTVTEYVPGRLWSSGWRPVSDQDALRVLYGRGVECITTVTPIGQRCVWHIDGIEPMPKYQRVLYCWDQSPLLPEQIDATVNLDVPTLIHCNAGKNRSTAIAICWLLRHVVDPEQYGTEESVQQIIDDAIALRSKTIEQPELVSDVMVENVKKYAQWLREGQLCANALADSTA